MLARVVVVSLVCGTGIFCGCIVCFVFSFLLPSCFSTSQPPARIATWGSFCHIQDSASPHVEINEVPVSLFLQPVEVHLNDRTAV